VDGDGRVLWRLDAGVWSGVQRTGSEWRLDHPTGALPAGRHTLSLKTIGPDGAEGEPRDYAVKLVRPAGDAPFRGWGEDEIDGPPPTPARETPGPALAPLLLTLALAAWGAGRRRL